MSWFGGQVTIAQVTERSRFWVDTVAARRAK
jgi:hypothetical protein